MRHLLTAVILIWSLALPAGAFQISVGTYTGNSTGAGNNDDRNIVISPAFQPVFCIVRGNATSAAQRWIVRYGTYTGDQSNLFLGTSSLLVADHIQAFNASGFQVGTNGRVNENGKVFYYVCLGTDAANDLAQGTYTQPTPADGFGVTTSPAFAPGLVILSGDTQNSVFRVAANSGDATQTFDGNVVLANMIQSFTASGFTIGTHARVQAASVAYHYLAIKDTAAGFYQGTYTSDNANGRQITTLGAQPEQMFIKVNSASLAAARFKDQVGDLSFSGANSEAADIIEAFLSNGFQVGQDAAVNPTGSLAVYWFALKTPPAVSGARIIVVD